MAQTTRLEKAIAGKAFLITAEVMPPKGPDMVAFIEKASLLKDRVHAINVTDSNRAVMRMSPLAASALLVQVGLEPICQLACRDRNRIALQGDLIGAEALGIHNILALTGDPVDCGDHPRARAVCDLESVRLLQVIDGLNRGVDSAGNALNAQTHLFAGAAIDPQSGSESGLRSRFRRKVEAGARFFQSQLITDFKRLGWFMDNIACEYERPVLAGVFLLKSAKNALYINRNLPGVTIPEAIIERLERAGAQAQQEGIVIAAEQVAAARQICDGVHLMAIRREEVIPEILDRAGVAALTSF
ncbi:methylenetetrahydrofolate reductase [Gloeobacter kilaueensis]|uniref:Methylenetetrahydrofolate reductase n=1 Tax=Gloeobacter kilaueensis (strain ATCC BAA-2537 / CCAP 1431/1 / ULC 316 / JS1) TaxID=1183438 RepID=U5QH61_GLOK1|nr:methylenetetrahydrofolate reductase [Gloeobacter kilaueensis]AGY56990.1 methylenetetrahydrofolate reductase [Gloeobacter kilaueensis JS1]